jgi:hypothetical protein
MPKRKKFNAGVDLDQMINELPHGVERCLLRVLSFHVGREKSIGRFELLKQLKSHGFSINERVMRELIHNLNIRDQLIGSTGGKGGGYWICESWDDFLEYDTAETMSRLSSLAHKHNAMMRTAEKRFGKYSPERQTSFVDLGLEFVD